MTNRGRKARPKPGLARPTDTICAVATAPGPAGIAVVRVSGPQALAVLDRLFTGPRPSRQAARTVRLGWIRDPAGPPVDQVLLTLFRSPDSFTGDDLAEISCHGGSVPAALIIDLLVAAGCRAARPGEFTRRAVLAGKLTLARAEALLDITNALSPAAFRAALVRYRGAATDLAAGLTHELTEALAAIEYGINFADGESAGTSEVRGRLGGIIRTIRRQLRVAEAGRHLSEGVRVAIIGRANAGKSSLFNRLLGSVRTLESPVRGTTRDRVDAETVIAGVAVRFQDTAGVCARPADRLARLAGEVADRAAAEADLVLAVFDSSRPAEPADRAVLRLVTGLRCIFVLNKSDLRRRLATGFVGSSAHSVSCRTGAGIGRLRAALGRRIRPSAGLPALAGERQLAALRGCLAAAERAAAAPGADIAAVEVREALDMLASIDRLVDSEAVLDQLFGRFCVGK